MGPNEIVHSDKVLCLRWMSNLAFDERYTLFEVFSGAGNVSALWTLG